VGCGTKLLKLSWESERLVGPAVASATQGRAPAGHLRRRVNSGRRRGLASGGRGGELLVSPRQLVLLETPGSRVALGFNI